MTPRFVGILLFIIIIACFAAGIVVYPYFPSIIISHWNAQGIANGGIGKFWGVFLLPFIMLLLVGVWALLPWIDPIAPGFKGFRYIYDFIFFLIIAFLAYVYALTLAANASLRFDMFTMILPALAAFIFILGALMPYLKRNWFVGIRTPWTISNDVVWDKTHRLAGMLFEIAGVVILIASFAPRAAAVWFIAAPIIIVALICVVYSYFLYRANGRTS